jgi:hypothetical protein
LQKIFLILIFDLIPEFFYIAKVLLKFLNDIGRDWRDFGEGKGTYGNEALSFLEF